MQILVDRKSFLHFFASSNSRLVTPGLFIKHFLIRLWRHDPKERTGWDGIDGVSIWDGAGLGDFFSPLYLDSDALLSIAYNRTGLYYIFLQYIGVIGGIIQWMGKSMISTSFASGIFKNSKRLQTINSKAFVSGGIFFQGCDYGWR